MPSITASFGAFSCYMALSDLDKVTDLRDDVQEGIIVAAGGDVATAAAGGGGGGAGRALHGIAYEDIAPTLAKVDAACGGAHLPAMAFFELLAEPIRIVCIWMAFGLLYFGYAHGGPLQMKALEMVRVDAADGDLDASDHKKQAKVDKKGAGALKGSAGGREEAVEVRFTHAEEKRAHRAAIRASQRCKEIWKRLYQPSHVRCAPAGRRASAQRSSRSSSSGCTTVSSSTLPTNAASR